MNDVRITAAEDRVGTILGTVAHAIMSSISRNHQRVTQGFYVL